MEFKLGQVALLNGKLCVIVGVEGDPNVPEEHLAAWFGTCDDGAPEAWTVPAEYFQPLDKPPVYRH